MAKKKRYGKNSLKAHRSTETENLPILIVAWRDITSGESGCKVVTSSLLRSCSINPFLDIVTVNQVADPTASINGHIVSLRSGRLVESINNTPKQSSNCEKQEKEL